MTRRCGTFFLQAFPHEVTDDPALWLGTYGHAFKRLDDLHDATVALGYDFKPLPPNVATKLIEDKAAAADYSESKEAPVNFRDGSANRARDSRSLAGDELFVAGLLPGMSPASRTTYQVCRVLIAALSLDSLDCFKGTQRCVLVLEEIDPYASDRADPAPFPHNRKVPEQTASNRHEIEARHVPGRIDAAELTFVLDSHLHSRRIAGRAVVRPTSSVNRSGSTDSPR
jgi:hypothetical protein